MTDIGMIARAQLLAIDAVLARPTDTKAQEFLDVDSDPGAISVNTLF